MTERAPGPPAGSVQTLVVAVLGAGLIGTSAAMALQASGHRVRIGDRDADVAALAAARVGCPVWVPGEDPGWEQDLTVALVAVPPAATGAAIALCCRLNPHLTVSDTASVKAQPLLEAERAGAPMSRVVGGHPVAGREHSGPGAALADLFHGRSWVLTPSAATDARSLHLTDQLARACGATPVVTSALAHDRALAAVSHMPQVVASAVAATLVDLAGADIRLAGPGVRDVTRIAGSDPALWRDILQSNAREVRTALGRVHARLGELLGAEEDDFGSAAETLLAAGRRGRAALPDKAGGGGRWVWAWVALPDRPGGLASILGAAGAAGVNVEDMRVRHADSGRAGWAVLAVAATAADELVTALASAGWSAQLHDELDDEVTR